MRPHATPMRPQAHATLRPPCDPSQGAVQPTAVTEDEGFALRKRKTPLAYFSL